MRYEFSGLTKLNNIGIFNANVMSICLLLLPFQKEKDKRCIYVVLMSDIFGIEMSRQSKIRQSNSVSSNKMKKAMKKINAVRTFNYMSKITRTIKKRDFTIPHKYDNLKPISRKQIPMKSIKNLIFQMDKSFDRRVSKEELRDFIYKKHLQHKIPAKLCKSFFQFHNLYFQRS